MLLQIDCNFVSSDSQWAHLQFEVWKETRRTKWLFSVYLPVLNSGRNIHQSLGFSPPESYKTQLNLRHLRDLKQYRSLELKSSPIPLIPLAGFSIPSKLQTSSSKTSKKNEKQRSFLNKPKKLSEKGTSASSYSTASSCACFLELAEFQQAAVSRREHRSKPNNQSNREGY